MNNLGLALVAAVAVLAASFTAKRSRHRVIV
jgi:hypothetical protein